MLAALAARRCWPPTRPRSTCWTRHRPAPRRRARTRTGPGGEGRKAAAGAPHVLIIRTPDGRLTWLQAIASRRKAAIVAAAGFLHRVPDHRRLRRLPAPPVPAGRHPAVRGPRDPPLPRGHEARPGRPPVLGRRRHRRPARGAPGRRGRPAPAATPALDQQAARRPARTLRHRRRLGIIHNRLRDWHDGNHPGYALGSWLRDYKEQVFLFTRELRRGLDERSGFTLHLLGAFCSVGVFAVVRSCCWSCVEYCVWH